MRKALATVLLTPLCGTALAHSGHGRGGEGFSLLHYLSEPEHVAAIALLPVLAAAAWVWQRRRNKRH
ncbi:MAG: hypothetical protein ACQETD_11900 [Pseudomonadota bacterium]